MRLRLDQALVERGLVRSRSRARDLIRRGRVTVAGRVIVRPSDEIDRAAPVAVADAEAQMVSRGALKLAAALDALGFDPAGRLALDVGASTGGFTQVLLARGARRVVAVDVGHGQLAPELAADPRVVSHEGLDARAITLETTGGAVGAITVDLSFIALSKALRPALGLAAPGAWLVALVKPQFEVGRAGVGKGGIVRDAALRNDAVAAVERWLGGEGWTVAGRLVSPITGGSGNEEFLVGARRGE